MPFRLRTRVGQRNHVLDGDSDPPWEGAILSGERAAHCKVHGHYAVSCATTAEPIEMLFGIWTQVGPRKHVLGGGAHWHRLVNTIEPSMCGSDAACCWVTLTTCYLLLRTQNYAPNLIFLWLVELFVTDESRINGQTAVNTASGESNFA